MTECAPTIMDPPRWREAVYAVGRESRLLLFPGARLPRPSKLLLLRHLRAGPTRLRETDGDRLLAALDFLAGAPAPQLPALPLAHGTLDLLRSFPAVLPRHRAPLSRGRSPPRRTRCIKH